MGLQKGIKKKKTEADDNSKSSKFVFCGIDIFTPWNIIGLFLCIICGGVYAYVVSQIHDARMFFTGIMEVEREISFRTENGLYYSYYKQLVQAPSFWGGFYDLMHDRLTEHPGEINILSRMNIYQEVLLAAAYRFITFLSSSLQPIFFYVYFVFALHGLLVCSLYLMAWIVSSTWLAGLMTVLFYVINSPDVTRVDTYMPLRENFSLPCLWIQLLIITVYFRSDLQERFQRLCERGLLLSTFFFALMWQFNQFALLLQAMALFGCQVLDVVDRRKILHVYVCQLSAMLVVSLLQFFNTMILTGFLISFIAACIVLLKIQERLSHFQSSIVRISLMLFNVVGVFILAMCVNFSLKKVFHQNADEHINRFVMTKFGFNSSIDFDVRLYLCNGGFNFLTKDFFVRLAENLVLPFYVVAHSTMLVLLAVKVLKSLFGSESHENKKNDDDEVVSFNLTSELSYHCIQMVFFGAVGVMAMRMKYFWTPYMCVFAAVLLFKPEPWLWIARKLNYHKSVQVKLLQTVIGVALMSYLARELYKDVHGEITNMREFYDPDTVELMNWIKNNTTPTSSFSGSMQLLAGVKLCTGRPITNHPHFEDKSLRLKTKEIYKYYGRYDPEEVHSALKKYETDYIIMEDSICLVPMRDGCGLPYIMDMEAGLEFDLQGRPLNSNVPPRFCDQVRRNQSPYSDLFELVLKNKTFRVYKVL